MLDGMRFSEWLAAQPHGTTMRLCRETGLALRTLYNVRDGVNVPTYATAKRISDATNGAVSIAELCEPAKSDEQGAA